MVFGVLDFLKNKPAALLLLFVYLVLLPSCLSYEHAWMFPDQFFRKSGIIATGSSLNIHDIKAGMNWQLFEYTPRITRPLSSYFEILDTKFRIWLWHYLFPHPSLSLTWIFSLGLAPFFLYRLLRNFQVGANTAIAMVSFYLMTPGVLSGPVSMCRPAKTLTNFFIIFCLYLASELKKKYLDKGRIVPAAVFWAFLAFCLLSFYWDETALLIAPSVFFFFPGLFKGRNKLVLLGLVPAMIAFIYFQAIPWLAVWAGYPYPWLAKYEKLAFIQGKKQFFVELFFSSIPNYLLPNLRSIIFETFGIMPLDSKAGAWVLGWFYASMAALGVLAYYIGKAPQKYVRVLAFTLAMAGVHVGLLLLIPGAWGPFYYGAFFGIYPAIYLALTLESSRISKYVLTACVLVMSVNMYHCFLGTNQLVRKYHYYPCDPNGASRAFQWKKTRLDPAEANVFDGPTLKMHIREYVGRVKAGESTLGIVLPKELGWLALELEPGQYKFLDWLSVYPKKYMHLQKIMSDTTLKY